MIPIFDKVFKIPGLINSLLYRIDEKTVTSIQRGFFFAVTVIAIIGLYIGYSMGKESARIKSPALFDSTNQIFDIDISRSKSDGDFSSLIDNEYIREKAEGEPERIKFRTQEKMEPEADEGLIESVKTAKRKRTPSVQVEEPVIEGEYRTRQYQKGDVKEIRKDVRIIDTNPEIITDDEAGKEPKEEPAMTQPGADTRGEGKTIRRIKSKGPQPIQQDAGILVK